MRTKIWKLQNIKKCTEKVNIRSPARRELIQYRIQINVKTALYKTKREPINLVKPQYRIIIIIIIIVIITIIII